MQCQLFFDVAPIKVVCYKQFEINIDDKCDLILSQKDYTKIIIN